MFQIFLITFAVLAILRTWKQYTKRYVSKYWFLLWGGVWALVILAALMPQWTDKVAGVLGVERGADLLVYTAVVCMAYLVYRLMVRQQKMNEEITGLVRKIALDRPEQM